MEDAGALFEVLIAVVLVVRVARESEEDKVLWGLSMCCLGMGLYSPHVFGRRISPLLGTRCLIATGRVGGLCLCDFMCFMFV